MQIGGTLSSECTGMEGRAVARQTRTAWHKRRREHICAGTYVRSELSAERFAHSPTAVSLQLRRLVRWPKYKDALRKKNPIGKNLRVSVRFVYHQIVLGARSPNH